MPRPQVNSNKIEALEEYYFTIMDLYHDGKLTGKISVLMRKKCQELGGVKLSTFYKRSGEDRRKKQRDVQDRRK